MLQAQGGPGGRTPRVHGDRRRGRHRPRGQPHQCRRRPPGHRRQSGGGRPRHHPGSRPARWPPQRLRPLDVHSAGLRRRPRGGGHGAWQRAGHHRRAPQPHPPPADDGADRGHPRRQGSRGRPRLPRGDPGPRGQLRQDARAVRDHVDASRRAGHRCGFDAVGLRPPQAGRHHPRRRPGPGDEHGGARGRASGPRPRFHDAGSLRRLPRSARRRRPRADLGRRRGLGR